ncbi:MAG TPA: hypothetical protein VGN14_09475 [Candidatus Elarobacter sp.]|jgi:hypothetical protein
MKRLALGAVLGVAILCACGGGGGGGSTTLPPGGGGQPTATPTPTVTTQSFSTSNAVAIPSAAPGATTVPVALSSDASSGASANAALPASASVPTDATIAVTYASTGDTTLPPLGVKRVPSASRSVRDGVTKNAIAFLKLQLSADISLPQAPGFTFTVPGTLATAGVNYWLAFYDPLRAAAGWQEGFEGPATVTNTTVNGKAVTQFTFASNGQPLTLVAGQTYWFAVIAIVANAATPTPVPSSVPTNPPSTGKPAKVVATPANVQFVSLTDTPVAVTFSETGFAGNFTLSGDCTGIVNTSGASPTWTLTPVGQGRCVIVALGDRGSTAVVHVGVITPYETPRPSTSPSASPSHSPEPSESPEPTHSPTAAPSHSPEPSESPEPTHSPTAAPSRSPKPTPTPTASPAQSPSASPSSSPGAK